MSKKIRIIKVDLDKNFEKLDDILGKNNRIMKTIRR